MSLRGYFNDRYYGGERKFIWIVLPLVALFLITIYVTVKWKQEQDSNIMRSRLESHAHQNQGTN